MTTTPTAHGYVEAASQILQQAIGSQLEVVVDAAHRIADALARVTTGGSSAPVTRIAWSRNSGAAPAG